MRGNSIAIEGRIYPRGRDEEQLDLRFSASGTAYSNFTISAWSHKNNDDENEYINYRCVAFGDLAENIAESFQPGDTVLALGRLNSDNWEDDDGNKRYANRFIVNELGASVRWTTVSINRVDTGGGKSKGTGRRPKARDDFGPDEAPF